MQHGHEPEPAQPAGWLPCQQLSRLRGVLLPGGCCCHTSLLLACAADPHRDALRSAITGQEPLQDAAPVLGSQLALVRGQSCVQAVTVVALAHVKGLVHLGRKQQVGVCEWLRSLFAGCCSGQDNFSPPSQSRVRTAVHPAQCGCQLSTWVSGVRLGTRSLFQAVAECLTGSLVSCKQGRRDVDDAAAWSCNQPLPTSGLASAE